MPTFIQLHTGLETPVFIDAQRIAAVSPRQGGSVVWLVGGGEVGEFYVLEEPREVFAAIAMATA